MIMKIMTEVGDAVTSSGDDRHSDCMEKRGGGGGGLSYS